MYHAELQMVIRLKKTNRWLTMITEHSSIAGYKINIMGYRLSFFLFIKVKKKPIYRLNGSIAC